MAIDDGSLPPAPVPGEPDPTPVSGLPDQLAVLPPSVAAAYRALLAACEAVAGVAPSGLDGAQAAAAAAALAGVSSRLGVVEARLLPVIEADGLWAVTSARSFAHWVAHTHRVGIRTARAQVRLGRALRDDLPTTAVAAAAGEVALEQAQTLARLAPTSDARRAVLADPGHDCNEARLVDHARRLSVDHFTTVVRRWAALADPDADDRGYNEACDREFLELSRLGDGYHLAGWLTVEHGQCLATALEALTPVPAADDQRTTTQRRAQALGDLARVSLDHGLVGTGRAVRPRINVLVGYDTLTTVIRTATAADETENEAEAGARAGQGQGRGQGQRQRQGQGTLPGFTAAALTDSPAGDGDQEDGSSPCPQFQDGTPIPRVLLDRLACDSELNRIIFGPRSEVLDVGRSERTFTGPRRKALVARDKHCRYPTCTAPPPLCEGHHVRQWARDHGTTSVTNGILLCWYHHDLTHRRNIAISRQHGRWVFTDRHGMTIRERPAA